jgi:hypothetical protein
MSLSETFLISPLSVPGCQLWLDGVDVNGNGTATANGASISTWVDKSGNGRNASQSTALNRPSYGRINGSSAIIFTGSPTFMTLPNITSVPVSIFMIAASTQNLNNTFFLSLGSYPNAIYVREQFSPHYFGIDGGIGGQYLTSVKDLNTHIWSFTLPSSASGTFAFDGSIVASSGFTLSANTSFVSNSIGTWNQQSANGNVQGGISEIIMYNTALSIIDRQKVEGYLAWKWGLTSSLPSTHPYKTSRPLDNIPLPVSLLVPKRVFNNVAYSLFRPTNIANCSLWLDGADSSTMFQNTTGTVPVTSSGSTVSLWRDKSVSANHASNTTAQPTVTFRAQNGYNVVNFSGSQYLTLSTTTMPTGTTHCSFFFVTRTTSSGVQVFFTYGQDPNTGGRNPQFYYNTNALLQTDLYGGGALTENTNYLNSYAITSCIFTNSNIAWDNGSQFSGGSTAITLNTGTGWASIGVGRIPPGNVLAYYLTGQIGEIIIFNRALSTSERQTVEGYLTWKWGLQNNFPATHPFRLNPPDLPIQAPIGITQVKSAFFNPRNISGLGFWLDAGDTSTILLSGSNVRQWNDKSGNGYNLTQATAGNQPFFSVNSIQFISDRFLNIPQASINNASRYSFFLVINPVASLNWIFVKQHDGNNTYNVISMTNNTTIGGLNQAGTTGFLYWRAFNAGTQANSGTALSTSTLQLLELIYDGTNLIMYRNGTQMSSTAGSFAIANATTATNFTLGAWIQGVTFNNTGVTNFFLHEMPFFSTNLGTAQRQQVEGYLAWKWKLQGNLPSTHPFKLFPPSP